MSGDAAERYRTLLERLEGDAAGELSSDDVEAIACHSYRHANRRFRALHRASIGAFAKRVRLDKAAECLKYSRAAVGAIAAHVGYDNQTSFGKAFRQRFGVAPAAFRDASRPRGSSRTAVRTEDPAPTLPWRIEALPELTVLYRRHRGRLDDIEAIDALWSGLIEHARAHGLFAETTICLGQVLDDDDITDPERCRYDASILLEADAHVPRVDRDTRVGRIAASRYARFVHRGSHAASAATYARFHEAWSADGAPDLADRPALEFYLNDSPRTPDAELLTEIYVPLEPAGRRAPT